MNNILARWAGGPLRLEGFYSSKLTTIHPLMGFDLSMGSAGLATYGFDDYYHLTSFPILKQKKKFLTSFPFNRAAILLKIALNKAFCLN